MLIQSDEESLEQVFLPIAKDMAVVTPKANQSIPMTERKSMAIDSTDEAETPMLSSDTGSKDVERLRRALTHIRRQSSDTRLLRGSFRHQYFEPGSEVESRVPLQSQQDSHRALKARKKCWARCQSRGQFPPFGIAEVMVSIFIVLSVAGIILKTGGGISPPWDIYAEYPPVFVSFFVAFGLRQVILRLALETILFSAAGFLYFVKGLEPLEGRFMAKLIVVGIIAGWVARFSVVIGTHLCQAGRGRDYRQYMQKKKFKSRNSTKTNRGFNPIQLNSKANSGLNTKDEDISVQLNDSFGTERRENGFPSEIATETLDASTNNSDSNTKFVGGKDDRVSMVLSRAFLETLAETKEGQENMSSHQVRFECEMYCFCTKLYT